ncbi:hypothetical protein L1987_22380 [Smallanthus sonchifolius]|uniref:Uncharacterized protein n=1 Tax=Smallanthus sonchifolius TaxID=185202 RepID=A0ACB9IFL1_9ASTR|nr:hypothetical protein L1987_22380 [Smallanthus sonchifolius]
MRIRKRFLSLSAAISTPPSSDLLVSNHYHRQQPLPRVQHQEVHPNGNIQHVECHRPLPPSSSDHTTQIGAQPATWTSSGESSHLNNTKIFKELESEKVKELTKTQDTNGKESILCGEGNYHDLVLKGWFQGDRLVPVKKKRGSFGRRLNNDIVVQDNETEAKGKKNDKSVAMGSKKKEKREGVIMEGSRCSRVNGRGWRCSQQTLVGYSLCEHHLGKGRLRSMTSVRGRSQTVALLKEQHTNERKDDDEDEDEDEDDEEFKDWDVESMSSVEGTKVFSKKTKVGVVKARSLSSLLSQMSS